MVHIAYDVKELLKACPVKIESVSLWSFYLFVSCIDGSLRIYKTRVEDDRDDGGGAENEEKAEEDAHPAEGDHTSTRPKVERPVILPIRKSDTITLHKTLIGFSKKPITSMTVIESKNLLISLSDAVVIHKLPTLDVMVYLSGTKGASLYAWNEQQGLLCVSRQKRLFMFLYEGRRGLVELPELSAPDNVVSMAWCGDSLCLGIRREYVLINTSSGAVTELFNCGPMAPPLVLPLQNGEVLLGKDNAGLFVGQSGKSTFSVGISWSDVPSLVVLNPPYVLAWLPRSIEIRYLLPPFSLVQTIFFRDMQLLPTGNHVVASGAQVLIASDHAVHALLLVPVGAQIVQLTASRKFEEALELCKVLPPEDAALRSNKEDDIHRRYGRFLFEQKEYAESMRQFAASSIDLLAVLSLFPSIKLPNFCSNKGHSPLSVDSNEYDPLDDYSESVDLYDEAEGELSSELNLERERIAAMSSLASYLSKKRAAIVNEAEAEDTAAALAAIVNDKASAGETKFSKSYPKVITPKSRESAVKYSPKELAIILDSALVQAHLLSGQSSAASELLSRLNFCDVDTCEELMSQGSYFKELLQLYKYNGLHRKVLELLNRLAMDTESKSNPDVSTYQVGHEEIIDYLKKLGGHDVYLVLESSVFLLKTCPKQAMSAYTSMNPPLPSEIVNTYLKENFPHLQSMYLEHLMENDKIKFSSALQNELVGLYLREVLAEWSKAQDEGSWDEHHHTEVRRKLLTMLENCAGYNCENVLKFLPANGLYEERAILLGRLGQHQLALTLYAHKLHKSDLALQYCDKVFLAANSANTMSAKTPTDKAALNVYLTLLRVYLKPTASLREYDRSIASLNVPKRFPAQRRVASLRTKGHVSSKIAQIEGWGDGRQVLFNESTTENGKSDGEDTNLQQTFATSSEMMERTDHENGVMSDEALDLLSHRWDRIDVGQALSLLPSDTKLQGLYPFLQPLVRKSSETRRNLSVIKNLRQSESLQVKQELEKSRRLMVKITNENTCTICNKKIGASVFVMYPNGILVHFVCHKSQKAVRTFNGPAISIY